MTPAAPVRPRHFASDNHAGLCPEAAAALAEANSGHAPGYGDDAWTARACDRIRALFETDCDVFLVFNGTAANALALSALCRSYHAVLCHAFSHAQRDECGAPGFFSGGAKLLLLEGDHAKVTPAAVQEAVRAHHILHASRPAALSLTQATELGTVYSTAELRALCETARGAELHIHMDGARFANAAVSLAAAPADLTWRAGVDVLSLGGTKNGLAVGEAVVFFNRALAREFDYRVKQAGQLASKMRFLAAPWVGLLESGAWQRNAAHANAMATRLESALLGLPGVRLLHPLQANSVFVDLPAPVIRALQAAGWGFYVFLGATGCRLMCSWDTTPGDVAAFAADLRRALTESNAQ